MYLEIDRSDQILLLEILEDRLGTLREQIYHATTTDFKEELKVTERRLRNLIGKLDRPRPDDAGVPPDYLGSVPSPH